jgi:hypothetical protein
MCIETQKSKNTEEIINIFAAAALRDTKTSPKFISTNGQQV